MLRTTLILCTACCAGMRDTPILAEPSPSFRNDVMAVLSKAGCNSGVCHGNQRGKGGFRLSLRGQDPADDFRVLTRGAGARRINRIHPERSLILLKPLMDVPHEGGRRFQRGSAEHRIFSQWLAAGMPADSPQLPRLNALQVQPRDHIIRHPQRTLQLQVRATFSDGSTRDVTHLAVYEPAADIFEIGHDGLVTATDQGETTVAVRFLERQAPVRIAFVPHRREFTWNPPRTVNYIDQHIFSRLRELRINPSAICDDTTFVRRAYLDLLGLLPSAAESRSFVLSQQTEKRRKLIDELLQRPEFSEAWALKWADLLRVEEKTLDRKGVQAFHAWIRHSIDHDLPLNIFAQTLVASRGSTYQEPESNFYRALRDPLTRAESTAQLFLGIRLQCAKCHNHPFDRWTQDDYYSWANLFSRVQYKILENRRRDRNDKHEFAGEQIVYIARTGEVINPQTGTAPRPRFLGTRNELTPDADRLLALSRWLGQSVNQQFARAQANRIWFQLLGRGLVDPVDDFRVTNPPSHPDLLSALAGDFSESGFRPRHLIRRIMNSSTYQLSSTPNATNARDECHFARTAIRRLSAEQLLDSLSQILDSPLQFNGYPPGFRAGQIPGVRAVRLRDQPSSAADKFLNLFGKPLRLQTCACERSAETTLAQTFQLVSGPLLNSMLAAEDNRLRTWAQMAPQHAKSVIDDLFWTALSRAPTPEERQRTHDYLQRATHRRQALEDIAWALLNSHEVILRR